MGTKSSPNFRITGKKWFIDFEKEYQFLKDFADKRGPLVLEQIRNFFELKEPIPLSITSNLPQAVLLLNEIEIPLKRMDGHTFKGTELRLHAIAPHGYKFEKWNLMDKDHSTVLQSFSKNKITVTAEKALNLQAEFKKDDPNDELPPIRINEVSASNKIHVNEYYSEEDWIELYNTTHTPVSIAGLYLSINPENPTQYRIPDTSKELTVIPPFGYSILWADKREDGPQLHVPFKLPEKGGTLQLSCIEIDSRGKERIVWNDRLTYTAHSSVETFGRYPDGNNETYCMNHHTFGTSNLYSLYNVSSHPSSIDHLLAEENEKNVRINYTSSSTLLTIERGYEPTSEEHLTIYNLAGSPLATYRIPAHPARAAQSIFGRYKMAITSQS